MTTQRASQKAIFVLFSLIALVALVALQSVFFLDAAQRAFNAAGQLVNAAALAGATTQPT